MQVIGVAGQAGSGKNELADYLTERLNLDHDSQFLMHHKCCDPGDVTKPTPWNTCGGYWQRIAFADAVKDIYCQAFGVDRDFIEKWKRNPEPPPGFLRNVRHGLQFIGDGFRGLRDDIWIETALRDEGKKLVLSDARYVNEAKTIKKKGGVTIIIYRPGHENPDTNTSEQQIMTYINWCLKTNQNGVICRNWTTDPEELCHHYLPEMNYYDIFVRNDGDVADLRRKVDEVVLPYIQRHFSG